ncbi:hypothetical protein J7E68_11725 [Microbacterium sp. ISL-103]|uniref:hypothetical protein n=1 Tax=Microbacterium sp. ISL-103 TaxID=2819156 RepID=UPI001BE6E992|nr:hypothetical protein [Microbacterium sp. ISL-103]MBT2475220.1 hypothetical protein [Microbacterium sp. ISL-103]
MSRSPHPQGSGRDARTSRLEHKGPLRGARWIVRSDPERLVRIAADCLAEVGFEPRPDGYGDSIRASGSDWTATAMEIGDEKGSRRSWWRGLLSDELPFPVPHALQHVLPPTLVVAASRPVAAGVAELVVFPHTSGRGDATHARAAAPRVTAALEQITAAAGAEGAMLSHESLAGIANDGSPASQAVVREVLGWR